VRRLLLVTAFAAIHVAAGEARAEQLTIALSAPEVRINSTFTGTAITIFGVIERDAVTVSRAATYEVAVVVAGPPETVVARRKDRFLGIWANAGSETIVGVPSFYTLITSRKLSEISSEQLLKRFQIGHENLDLVSRETGALNSPAAAEFAAAFLRLKQDASLYVEQIGGVTFIGGSVFRSTVWIPANVPTGRYSVTVFLFSGDALLARASETIGITKTGFEEFMFAAAHEQALLYGLACIALALIIGWLAGVIFRRD
jgi:uncharacterized protein (TIGR02186 family)